MNLYKLNIPVLFLVNCPKESDVQIHIVLEVIKELTLFF